MGPRDPQVAGWPAWACLIWGNQQETVGLKGSPK